ncbi:MAG: hypothetical protein M9904_04200 [Chitinophagaceae bacterium]|nr:hypothetical protein [Chitinophagaceae bacterium]
MKKTLFCLTLFLSLKIMGQQKEEKIVINNSRIAFTIEAGMLETDLSLKGDSKYYNKIRDPFFTYEYYNGPDIKDAFNFSAGSNIEYHLVPNSRIASINLGLHYNNCGYPIFISKGDASNNFPKVIDGDEIGLLKMQSIRIPVFFYVRLFKLFGSEGVGLETGANFNYLINAIIKPGKIDGTYNSNPQVTTNVVATDAFKNLGVNLFAGFRAQIWKIYLHGQFGIVPNKKIFKEGFANYDGDSKFEQNFTTSFGVGYYLKQ